MEASDFQPERIRSSPLCGPGARWKPQDLRQGRANKPDRPGPTTGPSLPAGSAASNCPHAALVLSGDEKAERARPKRVCRDCQRCVGGTGLRQARVRLSGASSPATGLKQMIHPGAGAASEAVLRREDETPPHGRAHATGTVPRRWAARPSVPVTARAGRGCLRFAGRALSPEVSPTQESGAFRAVARLQVPGHGVNEPPNRHAGHSLAPPPCPMKAEPPGAAPTPALSPPSRGGAANHRPP